VRRLGDILFDVEDLMTELVDEHDMQVGDILNLIHGYLVVHCPGAFEEYEDGTKPVFFYGPKENK
jgi:hypothetical protein